MRLHQIYEDDLAELEHTLPQFYERLPELDNKLRVQFRRVREILSNVRWNYGPHGAVEVIKASDE